MKGVYCLIINVKKNIDAKIGSLGKLKFKKGNYIYIGSAQNNIEKRVERHFKQKKRKYWHIDYLLNDNNVKLQKYLYKKAGKKEECKIARFLALFEEPIKNFGCSDCSCKSHLFKIKKLDINKLNMKEPK